MHTPLGPCTSPCVQVVAECGATDRLYGVSEPSRCEYTARFETPAACGSADVLALHQELRQYSDPAELTHDEL